MSDLDATSRCVKCGLCLPHCPSFRLTGNEADSPRGRITLMQAMQQDDRLCTPGLLSHLDRCLQCGACEAMCPSQVPFGALMDATRDELERRRRRSPGQRLLRRLGLKLVTAGSAARRAAADLLRLYRLAGLQRLARAVGLLRGPARRLDNMLVRAPRTFARRNHFPAVGEQRGTVQLFTGCIASVMDADTLDATVRVLTRLGYRVEVPAQQGCCGALHQHNGETGEALRLAQANACAFSGTTGVVIGTTSACTAQLAGADGLGGRIQDIHRFLCEEGRLQQLPLDALPQTVAVHMPCTQRNLLRQTQAVRQVLEAIPGIRLAALNPDGGCCGAAGSYFISQPEMSDRLREDMLAGIGKAPPALLVTTNIGCALQLAAGAAERGWPTEVLHPVTLLARQLRG